MQASSRLFAAHSGVLNRIQYPDDRSIQFCHAVAVSMCHKPGDIPYPETSSSRTAKYYVKKDKSQPRWGPPYNPNTGNSLTSDRSTGFGAYLRDHPICVCAALVVISDLCSTPDRVVDAWRLASAKRTRRKILLKFNTFAPDMAIRDAHQLRAMFAYVRPRIFRFGAIHSLHRHW